MTRDIMGGPFLEPIEVTAREYLGNAYWSQAKAFGHLDRHADALLAWDRAIELAGNDRVRAHMVTRRARTKSRLGQVDQAIADVEALVLPARSPDGDALYNVACIFSRAAEVTSADTRVAAAERTRRAGALADQAMSLLRQLVSKDDFQNAANLSSLRTDADLASLRSRADFQELLGELEAQQK